MRAASSHLQTADPQYLYVCSLQEIFLEFKNTKLQPGQSCPQCQGTWDKLEAGGKCPQDETPSCSVPRASHWSPRLDPLHPPALSRVPTSLTPGDSLQGVMGSASTAQGEPARHREHQHGIHGHHAPRENRAAGRKWGLPASAKYQMETHTSLMLWSCRDHELKVRPRSQLRSGVAGAQRSCCVSALQTPSNSSHRSSFARHFLYCVHAKPACRQPWCWRAARADEHRRFLWQ